MDAEEEAFYSERIITDYFIKFALLAVAALMLFGLSTVLPTQIAFVLTASVLISATIIVFLLALFIFVPKFKTAVILFEKNVKIVTMTMLIFCLLISLLALAAVLLR